MRLTLILMRHTKSSWGQAGLDDHERPLNTRGQAAAKALGRWLKANDFVPGQTLVSSAKRAQETFARLHISAPPSNLPALYLASPDSMLAELKRANAPCVLMIGHNPGIAEFAKKLAMSFPTHRHFVGYPTGATAVLHWNAEVWNEISWRTSSQKGGQLIDFVVPRDIST